MLKLSDNGFGTLGAPLTAGATALTLTAGHGLRFPVLAAGDVLPLCIVDANGLEEIIATARATDTLTIVRAMGGTTARAFAAGSKVQCRLSSEALLRLTAEAGRGIDVTGTNTYVGTWSPAPVGYVKGVLYRIIIANANTGPSTVNIGGLGAIPIRKNVADALAAGDLPAGHIAEMVYDGTNMQLLNPATSVWKPGDIKYSATPEAQDGWLPFSTAGVSRTTYAALYAKLVKNHNGTTTTGSAVVTALGDTSDLKVGMRMGGTGIKVGARIQSIDSGTQVTMNKTASASNAGTPLQFHWWGLGDGVNTFDIPGPNRVPVSAGSATTVVETFTATDIDTSANTIKVRQNKDTWFTGMQVTVGAPGTAPTTNPANLLDNNDVAYVIRIDDETIQLASTFANACNATSTANPLPIDITAAGVGPFTLTRTLVDRVVGESGGEDGHVQILPELAGHNHNTQRIFTPGGVSSGILNAGANTFAANDASFMGTTGVNNPANIMQHYHVMYGMVKA